jgi:hypothetical protein
MSSETNPEPKAEGALLLAAGLCAISRVVVVREGSANASQFNHFNGLNFITIYIVLFPF